MSWITSFYRTHPEYRALRVARRSACSIHFELAPGLYEAHFQIRPIYSRVHRALWLPSSLLADAARLVVAGIRNPIAATQFAAGLPLATIDTFQPVAATGKDTDIRSAAATNNYGVTNIFIGAAANRGLLEIDISSIPSAATCNNATLYLYQGSSGTSSSYTVTVYSISAGNAAWVEGGRSGAQAAAGEPCWNALAADGAGGVTTAWAGSAGLSTSGTDYEASSIGTFSGNRSDAAGTERSTALTAARVQGWFGAVNTNYGILLVTSAASGAFATSDHATAEWHPKLVVTYQMPSGSAPIQQPFAAAFRAPFGE